MIFTETILKGAYVIDIEPIADERGFFARSWCKKELQGHGLNSDMAQCNISFNQEKGTLRGMHYQVAPYEEAKLVRCTRGALFDVIIDLRKESESYKKWTAIELSAENRRMVYVPVGFAHGFQTLEQETEVFYHMTEFYHSQCSCGVRWDDPAFDIKWPVRECILSKRDRTFSDYI